MAVLRPQQGLPNAAIRLKITICNYQQSRGGARYRRLTMGPHKIEAQPNFFIKIILGMMLLTTTIEDTGIDITKNQMISNLGIIVKSGIKVRVVSKYNDDEKGFIIEPYVQKLKEVMDTVDN
eukprot:7721586-Heterocapsa_arctica.AAC.1